MQKLDVDRRAAGAAGSHSPSIGLLGQFSDTVNKITAAGEMGCQVIR